VDLAQPPNTPQRVSRAWRGALVLFIATVVVAPFLADRLLAAFAPAPSAESMFKRDYLRAIDHHRTAVYLVGNSMLATRIVPERLEAHVREPVLLHEASGMMSAAWYLMIKNYALAAERRPREVVVFFRDANLTQPFKRTGGKYAQRLLSYRHDREPAFNAVMRGTRVAGTGWLRRLQLRARHVQSLFELPHLAHWGSILPGSVAAHLSASGAVPAPAMPAAVNSVFRDERYRSLAEADDDGDGDTLTAEDYDFDDTVQRSFLPLMLDAAEHGGMHLTFVRVKTRALADGREQDPLLARYMVRLRDYLERHRATLVDMTAEPRVTAEWFDHGDHLKKERRAEYTDVFYAAWQRARQ